MKIDRLIGILTVLLQVDKTTAPALAERFEVSRRTILRDIDSLCLEGIPIVTHQGGDGGISIMEGYKINKSVLTTDELSNLVAALKGLDSISKTSYFESLNKLAPDNKALKVPTIIPKSSAEKKALCIMYTLRKILKQAKEQKPVSLQH